MLRGDLTNRPAQGSGIDADANLVRYDSAGIFGPALEQTLVCRYNDLPDVEQAVEDNSGQVAAIIVEPIMHNSMTIAPREGFLEGLLAQAGRLR